MLNQDPLLDLPTEVADTCARAGGLGAAARDRPRGDAALQPTIPSASDGCSTRRLHRCGTCSTGTAARSSGSAPSGSSPSSAPTGPPTTTQNGRCWQRASSACPPGVATGEVVQGAGAVVTRADELARVGGIRLDERTAALVRAERRLDAPLAGREEELAHLRAALAAARDEGRCRVVTVVGEPGIGKTRLARELALREEAGTTVLVARCIAHGQGVTFLPLLEALRRAEPEQALAGELDAELVLARLTALAEGAESAPLGESYWAVRRLLEALARTRPVLLVLDDVHWAEPALVDLVDYLADRADAPLLVFCSRGPSWSDRSASGSHSGRSARRRRGRSSPAPPRSTRRHAKGSSSSPRATPSTPSSWPRSRPRAARGCRRRSKPFLRDGSAVSTPRSGRSCSGQPSSAASSRSARSPRSPTARSPPNCSRSHAPASSTPPRPPTRATTATPSTTSSSATPPTRSLTKADRADLHERAAAWIDREGPGDDAIAGYHLEQAVRYRRELGEDADELAARAGERLGEAGMRVWRTNDVGATGRLLGRAVALFPARRRRAEAPAGALARAASRARRPRRTRHARCRRTRQPPGQAGSAGLRASWRRRPAGRGHAAGGAAGVLTEPFRTRRRGRCPRAGEGRALPLQRALVRLPLRRARHGRRARGRYYIGVGFSPAPPLASRQRRSTTARTRRRGLRSCAELQERSRRWPGTCKLTTAVLGALRAVEGESKTVSSSLRRPLALREIGNEQGC